MEKDSGQLLRDIFALAGIPLSEERIPLLARSLPVVRLLIEALSAIDYGETEPAARFVMPRAGLSTDGGTD